MKSYISIIIFLSFITTNLYSQKSNELKLVNLKGDTILLHEMDSFDMILFTSLNSCTLCFDELESFLKSNIAINKLKLVVIIRCINSPPVMRSLVNKYNIHKLAEMIYFDFAESLFYEDKCDTGIFNFYGVCRTPSIAVQLNRKIQVVPYNELFNDVSLSSYGKKKLIEINNYLIN